MRLLNIQSTQTQWRLLWNIFTNVLQYIAVQAFMEFKYVEFYFIH